MVQVADKLREIVRPGDLVIALGAGDINQSARDLLAALSAGQPGTGKGAP